MLIQLGAAQLVVGVSLPLNRSGSGRNHSGANRGARLAGLTAIGQFTCRNPRHVNLQIDAVEQWSGDAAAVAGDLVWRAAAMLLGITGVAARAGIHCRNELERRGIFHLLRCPRDNDPSAFQRFAQGFEHGPLEFR